MAKYEFDDSEMGEGCAEYSTFWGGQLSKIIKICPLFYMTRPKPAYGWQGLG